MIPDYDIRHCKKCNGTYLHLYFRRTNKWIKTNFLYCRNCDRIRVKQGNHLLIKEIRLSEKKEKIKTENITNIYGIRAISNELSDLQRTQYSLLKQLNNYVWKDNKRNKEIEYYGPKKQKKGRKKGQKK